MAAMLAWYYADLFFSFFHHNFPSDNFAVPSRIKSIYDIFYNNVGNTCNYAKKINKRGELQ